MQNISSEISSTLYHLTLSYKSENYETEKITEYVSDGYTCIIYELYPPLPYKTKQGRNPRNYLH